MRQGGTAAKKVFVLKHLTIVDKWSLILLGKSGNQCKTCHPLQLTKGERTLGIYTDSFSYFLRDTGLGEGPALISGHFQPAAPMDQTNFGGQIMPQAIIAGVDSWKSGQRAPKC